MASDWRISFTLIDTRALKTTLNFQLHSDQALLLDAFTEANDAANALNTALAAVTDANIYNETVTLLKGGTTSLPADADVTDLAIVVCYLSGVGEAPKYHALRVPAPVDGLFEADLVTVDKSDADLIAYVAEIAADFLVSDGEVIDTSIDDGIAHGYWASAKKSTS